ncbi:MAG: ABC transporter ATP-binding protein [Bacillota bacterium]|nr:ABC transporter ATP-binding protein [Bacillota bacterium]
MSLIEIKGLKKSFQGREVIKGLNFSLEKGKCTALIGPNGAGKTTTLRMLSGLMNSTEGTIVFEGTKKGDDIRKFIGYLPQFPVFYDWMSGIEFLEYVGKLSGLSKKVACERALHLLQVVGIIDAKKKRIGKYSGGMKQRLGIAQALIHRPQLLMLDEPVSALDPFGRREILELLEKLKKETTILFSTHILNDAEEICNQILFLHNGQLVESGSMEELRERYQQSRIDIIFQNNEENYKDVLKGLTEVESITSEGKQLRIYVNDIELARREILRESMERNWPLVKFEVSGMTLEDVFMKVVGK